MTEPDTSEHAATRTDEGGYIAPMTALLLVPLMLFSALAIDVGAWYVRADQAQKTADAAALAGTVWLPDQSTAVEVAVDVAARNGFRDPSWTAVHGGVANASVTVPGITAENGLIVEISTDTPSYFGAVVLDSVNIRRRAVAKVVNPVRMGNPSNALGTGNLALSELGVPPDGIWLGLNGWCSDHQNGDPFSVEHYGAWLAGGSTFYCGYSYTGLNPTYDPEGYDFIVDIPSGAGPVALEIFEPGLCVDANTSDELYSAEEGITNGPPLRARVYQNDGTEHYHDDNLATTPVVDITYATNECTGGSGAGGRWYTMHTVPSGATSEGRWYIRVTAVPGTSYTNMNMFSLRARPTADTQLCSSMTDATCPEIYARDWLPLWRPSFGSSTAGQVAEFFLADIDDAHAGKTVEIRMFDPGEGMDNIQFLDPSGAEQAFEHRLANCSVGEICSNSTQWPETTAAANDTCGSVPCLDVTGSRFQDQWLVLTLDLPTTYSCGANCWWKVRYTPVSGGIVADRTTWGVRVIGDPVHLTE